MANWAKIEDGIVVQVNVVEDEFLQSNPDRYTGTWIKTSYNTIGGVHILGGTPLRKNYAGVGYIYDQERDAFYSTQPYPSWVLNEEECSWNPPIPLPEFDAENPVYYEWNEEIVNWQEISNPS